MWRRAGKMAWRSAPGACQSGSTRTSRPVPRSSATSSQEPDFQTEAGERPVVDHLAAGRGQVRLKTHRPLFATGADEALVAPGLRSDQQHSPRGQLFRRGRWRRGRKTGGRGGDDPAVGGQPAHHQAGTAGDAIAKGQIDVLTDQIDDGVGRVEMRAQFGMGGADSRASTGATNRRAKADRRGDADRTGHGARRAAHRRFRFAEVGEDPEGIGMKAQALGRRRLLA